MADRKATESATTGAPGRLRALPGADRLVEELQGYVQARVEKSIDELGDRMGSAATKLGAAHLGPRGLADVVGRGGRKLVGESSPGSALSPFASAVMKGAATHAKDAAVGKVKEAVTGGSGKTASAGAGGKSMTVVEDIDVGLPVREVYDQWTQFQEFGRFAKGVVSVERRDETTSDWQVKVAKSNRAWKGTVTEQIPDERIAWTSEGAKGTTRGVVTFHPLGENLTKVLLVLEYFPKGVMEKTGNLWRAQGRRVRLDLKAFRKFVTMRGEATGAWRGEIRDGEVVRGPEEVERDEEETRRGDGKAEGGAEDRAVDDDRGDGEDGDEDEPEGHRDPDGEGDEGYGTGDRRGTDGRGARAGDDEDEDYEDDEDEDWEQDVAPDERDPGRDRGYRP